ncbi:bcl-2-interacting killer [Paramormyrops kingsleyae]|uniref:bcl-2-interacting killer n=1 Tax=Paramormyrops kingsleyae TaxID=1676925 RepID=UPI003B97845D
MVAQGKEPNKMRRLQAGSSEADNGFHADVDVRAARHIGQQLAAIGDQLNRQLSDAHLAAWLPGDIGNLLARGAPYWVFPGVWRELNTVTTVIQGWLTELLCRQMTQTVERWRIWVSVHPSGGLVALILLVTAAAWSYF